MNPLVALFAAAALLAATVWPKTALVLALLGLLVAWRLGLVRRPTVAPHAAEPEDAVVTEHDRPVDLADPELPEPLRQRAQPLMQPGFVLWRCPRRNGMEWWLVDAPMVSWWKRSGWSDGRG